MTDFAIHTVDSAPEGARDTLRQVAAGYGFLPNLLGVMAEAPSLLKGYVALSKLFSETSLSSHQQQVVLLAVSRFNDCEYCLAAHGMAARRAGLAPQIVAELLDGRSLSDPDLEALRAFTVSVVESRGFPTLAETESFLAAGYSRANILEVILGVGMKTLSNYTNHIAETPLDDVFRAEATQASQRR